MDQSNLHIHIVGGGLAGTEAAWQLLNLGHKVTMHEMRDKKMTPAHKTGNLAELVCSNSLKSLNEHSAAGRLKEEMRHFKSLMLQAAHQARVPAGAALAVDRLVFSSFVSSALENHPNFTLNREEVTQLPLPEQMLENNEYWIVASGPLTSDDLAKDLEKLCQDQDRLFFYDAIAPVIAADSIDFDHAFRSDRYGEPGQGDYINIPLNKEEYEEFIKDLLEAEKMPLHAFEQTKYFESCLPIEVMAERGVETLRFGPMKPVGLVDPKTGSIPYAAIQLRIENKQESMFSMVGFQTKMKWPEQKRVFSKLKALRNMEFFRYGSVHRNTYVESPKVLNPNFSFRLNPRVFLAGQITGVEGYTESAAIGLLVGQIVGALAKGSSFKIPPEGTLLGSLANYVTKGCHGKYAPMNANLGLLPGVKRKKGMSKADKKVKQCQLAQEAFEQYCQTH